MIPTHVRKDYQEGDRDVLLEADEVLANGVIIGRPDQLECESLAALLNVVQALQDRHRLAVEPQTSSFAPSGYMEGGQETDVRIVVQPTVLRVLGGGLVLAINGERHELNLGGWAYLPRNMRYFVRNPHSFVSLTSFATLELSER